MAERALTERQRRFVTHHALDPTNRAASARAAGYAVETAREAAYRLLTSDHIQRALEAEREHLQAISTSTSLDARATLANMTYLALHGEPDSVRVRATELIGRVHGLFVERLDVEHRLAEYQALTTDELRVLAQEAIEARQLAAGEPE